MKFEYLRSMKAKKIEGSSWLIRINRGEKILTSLTQFCLEKKIFGGFFYGIGACSQVELAHYNVGLKKYSTKKFNQPLEMINLNGNIALTNELVIHTHAIFSDNKMNTIGGHLVEATVSGTAEIYLITTKTLKKKLDTKTGLKIFDL